MRSRSGGWLRTLLVLSLWLPSYAQAPTGEIRLEVRDPSGGAVEASGRVEDLTTGSTQPFRTGAQGSVAIPELPYGRYRVEVTATGFAPKTAVLEVRSAAPVTRKIMLSLVAQSFQVDVVESTPLPGTALSRLEAPLPVQAGNAQDIASSGAVDLSDFLNKRLGGVYINELQGNPYQADLNYRGYTASPLLGTPQGMSIYLDGVRMNQSFGDVVSWDLIPRIAVEEVALIPGSNPMFGLNTLGGAVSLQTKSGRGTPSSELRLSGGSFGRKAAEFEHGGARSAWNWYLAGNLFFEDGWRDYSPSDVRQFFGRFGWQKGDTTLGLTASYANNALVGNGLQEQRLLAADYSSVYTLPDITANQSPAINFMARRRIGKIELSGNVYHRYIRTNTVNGDLNDDSLEESVYQPSVAEMNALRAAGYSGFPASGANASNTPFPKWRCIAQALLRDEPAEKCNGLVTRSHTGQHNTGFSVQGTWFESASGWRNQFTVGTAYDRSSSGFQQLGELGYLNPDRSVTGVGAFGDGITGGNVDGAPFDTRVDLDGRVHTASLFVTDLVSRGKWNFTVSARWNRTTVDNRDRIQPEAGPGSLTGRHTFDRFNPAFGVTYSLSERANTYFSYSEGSRAPTSVELGCADPENPCKLPNAVTGDPPLDQVVARTFEAGVRSGQESRLNWSAGWFRARNSNDILFVASPQTGFGYFRNFGETGRQGFEANAHARVRRAGFGANYTYLHATYESAEVLQGEANSSNAGGLIPISPGDRIPLTPRHTFKAYADLQATKKLAFDVGLTAISGTLARGNENNAHQPDGIRYLGPGSSSAYAVVNLGGRYQATRHVQFFGQVNNLFNRRYYTAAQLGVTGFTSQATYLARPLPAVNGDFPQIYSTFYAPGAPIGAWGGIRVSF